jgi:SAM-dependent methyltransferase
MELDLLTDILRCPTTGSTLQRTPTGLQSASGCVFPIVGGVPVFTQEGSKVAVHQESHLSNSLAPTAHAMITNTRGRVLNLSAGGSTVRPQNVVELEYSIFRNTNVVGDAHKLPFANDSFAGCICMNAFEHYHSPGLVASEVLRVLQPGGWFFMHTAGLQPLHEAPHHYYNATYFGVTHWLRDFQDLQVTVSPNFHPVYALSWLASEIERGMARNCPAEATSIVGKATISDLTNFWRDPASRRGHVWEALQKVDPETQRICAAGWQATGRKPLAT